MAQPLSCLWHQNMPCLRRSVKCLISKGLYAHDQGSFEKHRNWDSISITNNLQTLPLHIEDDATMHPEFLAAIKHTSHSSDDPSPGAARISRTYWTQRILVANTKGVAHTILSHHMPACKTESCKHDRNVQKLALIPIQRNAFYNSNTSLQATAVVPPTYPPMSTFNPQLSNSNSRITSQSGVSALPLASIQQPPRRSLPFPDLSSTPLYDHETFSRLSSQLSFISSTPPSM